MIAINIVENQNLHLVKDNNSAKTFFLINGVINSVFCPNCSSYSKAYKTFPSLNTRFVCSQCNRHYSNKSQTFFEGNKLKFNIIFLLLKLFIDDFRPSQAKCIINDYIEESISLKSIRVLYTKLRAALRRNVFAEMRTLILNGPCEINETPIYKQRPGYPFARQYQMQYWFIGIRCRQTHRFVIYPVLWRNHDTLITIILRHVSSGSIIYSDCWSGYYNNRTKESKLMPYGYIHYTVNHSQQFVSNFSNSIHINKIERTWRTVKSYIRMLKPKIYIDDYVAKFYLNEIYTKQEIFERILKIMADTKFS